MWDFFCIAASLGLETGPMQYQCGASINMWTAVTAWEAVKMPFAFLFGSLLALIIATFLLNWSRRNFGGG